jgi:putative oxidoreductase
MNSILRKIIQTDGSLVPLSLRVILGLTMAAHGAQKLFGWFGGYGLKGTGGFFESSLGMSPGVFWAALAGGGEFFGGLLILFGFLTRFGALNIAITMLVGIISAHSGAFFAPSGMEYPLALLGMATALMVSGGGKLSIDGALTEKGGAS